MEDVLSVQHSVINCDIHRMSGAQQQRG